MTKKTLVYGVSTFALAMGLMGDVMGSVALAAAKDVSAVQVAAVNPAANPLLEEWKTPFGVPPFASFKPEHFSPAFTKAMADHAAEVKTVAQAKDAPTFVNTIEAMERSGKLLTRVANVFFNLTSSVTNEALQAVELEMAPKLSAHFITINVDPDLFKRVDALYQKRTTLGLAPEQIRLLERYHLNMVRQGAKLDAKGRERAGAIGQELAVLTTKFAQNVLSDEKNWQLVLEGDKDLAGLSESQKAAAATAAKDRGLGDGKHVITLSRGSVEPFLTYSSRRDLREKAFHAWAKRGDNGDATDNNQLIREIMRLRTERAKLLGYENFAAFKLADSMAKTPKAAMDLMRTLWEPTKAKVAEERALLQAVATAEGMNAPIEAWDWRYYAEKVRKAKYDLDESEIKPYFQVTTIAQGAFDTAERLFGITFVPNNTIPVYHPDVRAYEVKDKAGNLVAIYMQDNFARQDKRSGAWMSSFRDYNRLDGVQIPIILNNNNSAKGDPSLLTFDDSVTLFHEFGHALHGILTTSKYPSQAGTNVLGDFVEVPSQIFEHWATIPETLNKYAKHYKTGEPLPQALIDKIKAADTFNQGFSTCELLASALVDMELHMQSNVDGLDAAAFEKATLAKLDMPKEIIMRHRLPHFLHLFSSDAYAAGYYNYIWAQVLEADGFAAFEEKGDYFDPALAQKLRTLLESGDTKDPMELFVNLRGREPKIDALLKLRGLETSAGKSAQ